ncbi:hypothetical protein PPERSA_12070 [Pseudocohnilembus persalinus]|uniref:LITAF domain-containing protein n=1 Tax=Pseudocohnilembus persalinus TaxID=266149 RepID=A0A0V0R931_PSEPJ|nr:hypothetical protein PPERSA_12070 [Pseudocohnilembus persalinus]|eukprot:KRX10946.1 hypothetical protein PPERSA_12070 [Pseudocohnilembus persalinus]
MYQSYYANENQPDQIYQGHSRYIPQIDEQQNQFQMQYLSPFNQQQQFGYQSMFQPQISQFNSQYLQQSQQQQSQQLDFKRPICTTCPNCQAIIETKVEKQNGNMTYLTAGILLLMACWPCCLLPFCIDDCKDMQHMCPQCGNQVHKQEFMENCCDF